jgi:hypothetical protein
MSAMWRTENKRWWISKNSSAALIGFFEFRPINKSIIIRKKLIEQGNFGYKKTDCYFWDS